MKIRSKRIRERQATPQQAAAIFGTPSAVIQAESVCARDKNNAPADKMRIHATSNVFSRAESDEKRIFTTSGANRQRHRQSGTAAASVRSSA